MVRKSKRFLVLAIVTLLTCNEIMVAEAGNSVVQVELIQNEEVTETSEAADSLAEGEEEADESEEKSEKKDEENQEGDTDTASGSKADDTTQKKEEETTVEETTIEETTVEETTVEETTVEETAEEETTVEETTEEETTEFEEIKEEKVALARSVQDDENHVTYTFNELEQTLSWGAEVTLNEDGTTLFSFPAQYTQAGFLIPEELDKERIEKVIINTNDDTSKLALKLYKDESSIDAGDVVYETNQIAVNKISKDDLNCFCLMGLKDVQEDENYEILVESVTFVLSDKKTDAEEQKDYVYTFHELKEVMSYDLEREITEDGVLNISYNAEYAEIRYEIPESVDTSKLSKLILNLESGDKKALSLKLLKEYDPADELKAGYEVSEIDTDSVEERSDIKYFGIMALKEDVSYEIASVEFVMDTANEENGKLCIQTDVPDLKDAIAKKTDSNFITGVSITNNELSDKNLMALVTKHFNAVTFGNELKPDCLFGYSSTCPEKQTVTLHGVEMEVPTMDYSRPEKMLDTILEWNENHPNDTIRVRGHVLVWHSQTPEWFFHEDYDANKDYVDAATMTMRQEWYIKTVLEHFTGEDSKYKDLFYGWDVVNEAVSDGSGTYRSEYENSSWWKVYGNNEFIINAFRFANQYAPADVELYYNDYNEWVSSKVSGIVQLLKDVKNAEGTRIDGMGMQGHYQTDGSPSIEEFKKAARAYAEVVGKVQITELDLKASNSFDGTSATLDSEYTKQAYRYKDIYEAILELRAEGVNMTNMTIWGVIDKNSWLQSSNSVGGASDGSKKQCPLLFDDDYQVKPAYWAFVDDSKLEPEIKKIDIIQSVDGNYSVGNTVTFSDGNATITLIPEWFEDGIHVLAQVKDASENEADAVTVYISVNGMKQNMTVSRKDGKETKNGYEVEITFPCEKSELHVASEILIDFVLTNGEKKTAYNDYTMNQEQSDKFYAKAILKPYTMIQKGTVAIDGTKEAAWDKAVKIPLTINLGTNTEATASLLWDEDNLYAFVDVMDPVLNSDSANAHEKDSFELFIDENNHKSDSYEEDDKQYRINYLNEHSFNGKKCKEENISSVVTLTEDGYQIEAAFAWTDITPAANTKIGLELQINDADASGKRVGTLSWYDTTGAGWSNPGVFGTAVLIDEGGETGKPEEPVKPEEPDSPEQPQNPDQSNQSTGSDNNSQSDNQPVVTINKLQNITEEIVPLASSVVEENDNCVNIMFSGKEALLRQSLLFKYHGKKLLLLAHLGNGIGYSIDAEKIGEDAEDINLAATLQIIEHFAGGFDSFRLEPENDAVLNHEIGIHINVGSQYAGQQAYIFQKNMTTGAYELCHTMPVNEAGNVAVMTNSISDMYILIQN